MQGSIGYYSIKRRRIDGKEGETTCSTWWLFRVYSQSWRESFQGKQNGAWITKVTQRWWTWNLWS